MELLEQRILRDGRVRPGEILKVDSFLNHQLDTVFLMELAEEFKRIFAAEKPTKVLTVEASGIALATLTGLAFGIPAVFAKKSASKNLDGDVYRSEVRSYTRGGVYDIMVEERFLNFDDRVLIIDDFLARGAALRGLIYIVRRSGAHLCGCGIAVEKGFQNGGRELRAEGVNLHSLAIVDSMDDGKITFRR